MKEGPLEARPYDGALQGFSCTNKVTNARKRLETHLNDFIIRPDFLEEEGTLQPAPRLFARGLFSVYQAENVVAMEAAKSVA